MLHKARTKAIVRRDPPLCRDIPNEELSKAIKMQKVLEAMQKNLEKEYSRLDVEFLQLASMAEDTKSYLINELTPVVFEDEETINKKDVVLTLVQPVVTNFKMCKEQEEEEEDL